jgi:hypothetical protein
MKVGDLVKLKDGSSGIIVEVVIGVASDPWAVLHSGEKFLLRDLKMIEGGIVGGAK